MGAHVIRDPSCIFCRIVSREIPAAIVFEDDATLAFLDVHPVADGHLLIIPKSHYLRLIDLPADLNGRLAGVLPKLGNALMNVTGAGGFNVLCNNGEVAGQVVPHVHFHLIPRTQEDGLGYRWNAKTYSTGKADEHEAAYRRVLSDIL
ncbi:MAG: HIT family protein [Planctomycetota bacterium]